MCSTGFYGAALAYPLQQRADQLPIAVAAYGPSQPQPAAHLQRRGQPVNRADRLDPELVGLHLQKRHPPCLYEMLVYSPALEAGLPLPTGDGALV